jgi:leucyl/phenylalanyl-tRNA--protein transferase
LHDQPETASLGRRRAAYLGRCERVLEALAVERQVNRKRRVIHEAPIVLTPEIVLQAYRRGAFPMGDPLTHAIEWYDPNPRAVVPLDGLHVTRTLRRVYRSGRFLLRSDAAFAAVIDACAARDPTWITPPIRAAYVALHGQGHAHSVEAWVDGRLVGGLYGVHLGGAFMGESMFHVATDASKVCLVALVGLLRGAGFVLLDTQFLTIISRRSAPWRSRARSTAAGSIVRSRCRRPGRREPEPCSTRRRSAVRQRPQDELETLRERHALRGSGIHLEHLHEDGEPDQRCVARHRREEREAAAGQLQGDDPAGETSKMPSNRVGV